MKPADPSPDISITRLYDAPVQAVWDAWTVPEQVAQWWGPRGFTLTSHHKDLRAGGTWKYTMHGPDGTDYPNLTRYHQVEPLRKLVYDHGGTEDRPPLFRVTVVFTAMGGKTRMDMTSTCPSVEAAAQIRAIIRQASGNSTWDRLSEHLEKHAAGKETFVINRSFVAPRKRVFDAWVQPEQLARWLPPTGCQMTVLEGEAKAGSDCFYCMYNDQGLKLYGRLSYRSIERPSRLVYTQQFADAAGAVARNPMTPDWPETMLSTVDFVEEAPDTTRVTVRWEPIGGVSAAELAAFVKMRGSMTQGWTGSFDQLEGYLAVP